ncbi:MAG: TraB/GumN family protein [Pseudomonadota bacterium]
MVNLLVAAAIALASPSTVPAAAPVAPVADASPALFVVRDADTTVYLFGTFHALDGRSDWFNNGVRTAFESSNELILETIIPEAPLPPAQARRPFGAPQVASSASFLATTRMAINAGKAQGMQVENGADMVLRHTAESEGKTVAGLETIESQLAMFSRMAAMTPAAPQAAPGSPAAPMASVANAMADMQSAWKRGDQSVFVNMLAQLNRSSPATYKMLFTDRNGRWADWVAARMQTPGTVFVAVGAGHFAGKDSVLAKLGQRGILSRRVY